MAPQRINIDYDRVMVLKKEGLKLAEIARVLGVKYRTLTRNLNRENKSNFKMNQAITDEQLLEKVDEINHQFPDFGYYQVWCALKKGGNFVLRRRVEEMMKIVDPEGVLRRTMEMKKIARIKYSVPHSHYLWHIDSYLKLGPYKLVIRGGMDGFSRTVVFLDVGTRNGAEDMLKDFKTGVDKYTTPFRVRSDKGREMTGVARFMRTARPNDPKCLITGRSVRNVKIERYWSDLRKFCVGKYIRRFRELEQKELLDICDPIDLACLHAVYLAPLRKDLKKFQGYYNSHGIRTLHRRSPVALLHASPMPRGLVVSEPIMASTDPLNAQEANAQEVDAGEVHVDAGVDFNSCYIPNHIAQAAYAIYKDSVATLDLTPEDQYNELRGLVHNMHELCQVCGGGDN